MTEGDVRTPHVETLPPRLRAAFELREQGLLLKEVAFALGINLSAASMRITRARDYLGLPRTARQEARALALELRNLREYHP